MNKKQSNIIKGCSIIFMLFHHLFGNIDRIEYYGLTGLVCSGKMTRLIANDMKVCVAIFVFVSGYGMARFYYDKSVTDDCYKELLV